MQVILGRHIKTNFCFLSVLGWTRQEGWGRWQRCWCKHVFLLVFYFPFCLFTVLQPYSLWQDALWRARVLSTVKSADEEMIWTLGFTLISARNPGLWGFLGHVVSCPLTMLSEHLLSPQWLFCHTELLQSRELLPHCPSHMLRDRLRKTSNCMCRERELEFSHICSPTLKYFPTSICPFKPISKAMGATNYSLSVRESTWPG